jgi:hypothetical protein
MPRKIRLPHRLASYLRARFKHLLDVVWWIWDNFWHAIRGNTLYFRPQIDDTKNIDLLIPGWTVAPGPIKVALFLKASLLQYAHVRTFKFLLVRCMKRLKTSSRGPGVWDGDFERFNQVAQRKWFEKIVFPLTSTLKLKVLMLNLENITRNETQHNKLKFHMVSLKHSTSWFEKVMILNVKTYLKSENTQISPRGSVARLGWLGAWFFFDL